MQSARPSTGIGFRINPNGKLAQSLKGLIAKGGVDPSFSHGHLQGVGCFQAPQSRDTRALLRHVVQDGIGRRSALIREEPAHGQRSIDHAVHMSAAYARPATMRSLIFKPPRLLPWLI